MKVELLKIENFYYFSFDGKKAHRAKLMSINNALVTMRRSNGDENEFYYDEIWETEEEAKKNPVKD